MTHLAAPFGVLAFEHIGDGGFSFSYAQRKKIGRQLCIWRRRKGIGLEHQITAHRHNEGGFWMRISTSPRDFTDEKFMQYNTMENLNKNQIYKSQSKYFIMNMDVKYRLIRYSTEPYAIPGTAL